MATVEQCETALHELASRLSGAEPGQRNTGFDRTLSCTIPDLDVVFTGHLHDGELTDITQASTARAQVRLTTTSDDLLALVDGTLKVTSAWASGRIKIQAGVLDLMKLRSIF